MIPSDLIKKLESAENYKFTDSDHLKRELRPLLDVAISHINARAFFETDQQFHDHLNKLYQALHKLSDRINRDFPDQQGYAARIQGLAQGLLPPKGEAPQIPQEIWGEIFSHMDDADFRYDSISTISQYTKEVAAAAKGRWVEEKEVSPRTYGCKTAQEAIQCIIDRHLPVANLFDYRDLTLQQLQTLIQQRPDLKSLHLPTHLAQIPPEIGQLQQLQKLDLESGTFTQLPLEIGDLTNLKWLNLSFCKSLTTLPLTIGRLTKLEHLNLAFTRFTQLPTQFSNLQNLKILNLQGCDFTAAPQIFQLTNLERLSISLPSIPAQIQNLQHLKRLTLFSIATPLPDELGSLKKLEELTILYCSITTLPHTIGKLKKLKTLQILPQNLGFHLPPEVGELENLRRLDCAGMGLPVELHRLRKLKDVRVAVPHFTDFQKRLQAADALAQTLPGLIKRAFNWYIEEDEPPLLEQNLAENERQALHEISEADLADMSHHDLVQAAKLVIDKLEIGLEGMPEELEEPITQIEKWIEVLAQPF